MLTSVQTFVQQRYQALLMAIVGLGFVLVFIELLNYRHYMGLQIVGLATTIIGALVSFIGIGATGNRRRILAGIFLVLSLAGVIGTFAHNSDRIMGEQRPPNAQFNNGGGQGQPGGQDEQGQQGQPGQQGQGGPGQPGGQGFRGGPRIPPPLLAPLSLSGFCILGAVVLLGRRDT